MLASGGKLEFKITTFLRTQTDNEFLKRNGGRKSDLLT